MQAASGASSRADPAVADLLIVGPVATLAGASGFGWVDAIGIADGIVVGVGRHAAEAAVGPGAIRWRLPPGACTVPGLTDAHLHLGMAAVAALGIRLGGLVDRPAVGTTIAAAHAARVAAGDRDGWLLGDGWSLDQLGGWPTASELEALAPGRPVALWSHDHHARWANTTALALAGIGPSGPGGITSGLVRREASGAPTGVLHEAAATLLDRVIPTLSPDARMAAIDGYAQELLRLGVTGVHDPGDLAVSAALEGPDAYRAMATAGRLPIRVTASVREVQLESAIETGMRTGRHHAGYSDGWLKLFADGALGSRSAALLAPYEPGDPGGTPVGGPAGLITHDADQMRAVALRAASNGIAVQIHGIGDAAVRAALDVLEAIPRIDRAHHRIEHAQLVHPTDVPRFRPAGISASVQPCHLCSDASAVRAAWGERSQHAFPIAALDRAGALIPFGTDAPVESPIPGATSARPSLAAIRAGPPSTWRSIRSRPSMCGARCGQPASIRR